jgi:anti-anti-sigma factor
VYGEVDAFSVPVLETALLTELDARPELLVVDLAGVTWFGVSGLIALVDVQEVAAATGASVRIAGAGPSVRRLVDIVGLTERFRRGNPAAARDRRPGPQLRPPVADRSSGVQQDLGPAVLPAVEVPVGLGSPVER